MIDLTLPLLVVLSAAPRGGAMPSAAVAVEPFATAAFAPQDTALYLRVVDGSLARRIVEPRQSGDVVGEILDAMAVPQAWRAFAEDLSRAQRDRNRQRPDLGGDLEEVALFDLLLGHEATLLARNEPLRGELEWVLLTRVDATRTAPLLAGLSPRIDGLGWRTLVGHGLAFRFEADFLLLTPSDRRGMAQEVSSLMRFGGARLAGTAALREARSLGIGSAGAGPGAGPGAFPGATVELLLHHPAGRRDHPSWTMLLAAIDEAGRVSIQHRSLFDAPIFEARASTAIDRAAVHLLGGRAGLAVIEPLTVPYPGDVQPGHIAARLASASLGPGASSPWDDGLLTLGWLLGPVDGGSLGHAVGGGPPGSLGGATTGRQNGTLGERRPVRPTVPAILVESGDAFSWTPREGAGNPPKPAGGEVGTTSGSAARSGGKAGSGVQSALVLEIGQQQDAVAAQQAALAEQVRRRIERAADGRGAGAGESTLRFASQTEPGGAGEVVTRIVRGPAGEFQIVGVGREFVESLARELSGLESAGSQGGESLFAGRAAGQERASAPLRSAGSISGPGLAVLLRDSLEESRRRGSLLRLAETIEHLEWRVFHLDGRAVQVEATVQLLPPPAKDR